MIDLTFKNTIKPGKGKILISDPFLDEDYFRRSIIYLCEHNDEGSFGFVLNNFISVNLHELDESFPNIETQISLGGPMEINSLYFIHTFGDQIQNSVMITDEIYLGGNFQELTTIIKEDETQINQVLFFIGYAGWKADQLETEISINSWIVTDFNIKENLFKPKNKQTWKRYMYDLGGKFKIMSKFPIDPNKN